jgi:hypothetical protein
MCLRFGFVIFCQKDFGVKAANKILVKLPPGRNTPAYLASGLVVENLLVTLTQG